MDTGRRPRRTQKNRTGRIGKKTAMLRRRKQVEKELKQRKKMIR